MNTCKRCGHEWQGKVPNPVACPECRCRHWERPGLWKQNAVPLTGAERMRRHNAKPEVKARRAQYKREYDARPDVREQRRISDRSGWSQKTAEEKYLHNKKRVLKQQGLTIEAFKRLVAERPNCEICGSAFDLPRNRHVDHVHGTDFFRGFLCSNCNTGIGLLADSPERLRAAADYLERANYNQTVEALLAAA